MLRWVFYRLHTRTRKRIRWIANPRSVSGLAYPRFDGESFSFFFELS
jgi:hypothetical protein